MKADSSRWLGRRTSHGFSRELSDGRACKDAGGLRQRALERIGSLPPLRREPGDVLRLAGSAVGGRGSLVRGSLARAQDGLASHVGERQDRDRRASPTFSASWAAQVVGGSGATRRCERLALGVDDRRYSGARRACREEAPSPARAGRAAPRDRGGWAQRGMGGRL